MSNPDEETIEQNKREKARIMREVWARCEDVQRCQTTIRGVIKVIPSMRSMLCRKTIWSPPLKPRFQLPWTQRARTCGEAASVCSTCASRKHGGQLDGAALTLKDLDAEDARAQPGRARPPRVRRGSDL